MKCSKILKASIVLAFCAGFTSTMAADACSETGGHTGNGTRVAGRDNSSVTGNVGSSGYHYEIWYQGGNNSMTYYNDGSFSAEWNNSNDFLARVGFKYNSDKTYEQIGQLNADFKFTKSGHASYSYIGIYGWTENPLVEYYIVEDWFSKPSPQYLGTKKGEITVDGDTYDIYTYTRVNQPSIKGTSTFPQFFSVRRNARQCGHINLTAHFKKWEEVGLKMGKLYEAKVLAEAGGGATGKIDFTYFKMTVGEEQPASSAAARSSSSVARSSSATAPKSSSSTRASVSSSSRAHHSSYSSSSSITLPSNNEVNLPGSSVSQGSSSSALAIGSSSSGVIWAGISSGTIAIRNAVGFAKASGEFQVFNMIGKFMGYVEVRDGSSLKDAVSAKFGKAGVYMVKQGATVLPVSIR